MQILGHEGKAVPWGLATLSDTLPAEPGLGQLLSAPTASGRPGAAEGPRLHSWFST